MHKYLKTIGFSHIESRAMLEKILQDAENHWDKKKDVETEDHRTVTVLFREYGDDCGIAVCGEYDGEGIFHRDYYYPYYNGRGVIPCSDPALEQLIDKDAYYGAYDDYSIGITLIFYVINHAEYFSKVRSSIPGQVQGTLTFSALAEGGKILFPVKKSEKKKEVSVKTAEKRNSLIAAAQKGDQEAIESLTMEDIDLYTTLARRIQKEDLYSIVNTTFIPCGLECDQYAVIGEIERVNICRNSITGERLYQMHVTVNAIPVDICINEKDLLGIPEPGRRFKGRIWLQGIVQ